MGVNPISMGGGGDERRSIEVAERVEWRVKGRCDNGIDRCDEMDEFEF